MKNTSRFLIVLLVGLCLSVLTGAQVQATGTLVITEVAASPAKNHEWVELYNAGTDPVSLENWAFFENDTHHNLQEWGGGFIVQTGGFAIIAQDAETFMQDFPEFSGLVLDSSWSSLKESGEYIAIVSGNEVIDGFEYPPAAEQFLQRKDILVSGGQADNWIETGATPGALWGGQAGIFESEETVAEETEVAQQTIETIIEEQIHSEPLHYFWGNVWINEVVSNPATGEKEWLELKSNKVDIIDLENWYLEDASGAKTQLSGKLGAFDFTVVENIKGNLNNSGDSVRLVDHEGNVIDEIRYGDGAELAAPGRGEALARIPTQVEPENNASVFKVTITPTPGQENNIQQETDTHVEHVSASKTSGGSVEQVIKNTTSSPKLNNTENEQLVDSYEYATQGLRVKVLVYKTTTSTYDLTTTNQADFGQCVALFQTAQAALSSSVLATALQTSTHATSTVSQSTVQNGDAAMYSTVAQAQSAQDGARVVVRGVVSAVPGVLGKQYMYIQDTTGGIQVYQNAKEFPTVSSGDIIEVSGERSTAYGQPRLKAKSGEDIVVVGQAAPVEPETVTQLAIWNVGSVVRVQGVVVEKSGDYLRVATDSSEVAARMRDTAPIDWSAVQEGDRIEVQGLVTQNNTDLRIEPYESNGVQVLEKNVLGVGGERESISSTITGTMQQGDGTTLQKRFREGKGYVGIAILAIGALVAYLIFAPTKQEKSLFTIE